MHIDPLKKKELVELKISTLALIGFIPFKISLPDLSTSTTIREIFERKYKNNDVVFLKNETEFDDFKKIKNFTIEIETLKNASGSDPNKQVPLFLLSPDCFIESIKLNNFVTCGHLIKIFNKEKSATIGKRKISRKVSAINIISENGFEYALSRSRFNYILNSMLENTLHQNKTGIL